MTRAMLLIVLLLVPFTAKATMPVEVDQSGDDAVGGTLTYYVKEAIRKSASLDISLDTTQARMLVNVTTLDLTPSAPGNSSVYSVDILWVNPKQPFPFYLTNLVGYCGSSRVQECADNIVAKVSEESDKMIKLMTAAAGK